MMSDVSAVHIDRYKTARLQKVKPVSVNVELRMLKSAFGTALRWKTVDENPCKGVPLAHVPDQMPIFLTPNDFETLIHSIPEPWFRELVVFAVLTGLRRAEIVNLRWVDVDLDRGVIHIQSSPRFKTKQGRRRTVPLNSTALEMLKAKRNQQGGEHVFTLHGEGISPDWVSHLFKRYVRKAKLADQRLHFHSVRHSFASWLVQGGATLYEVQKLLGHSSPKVTEIYSHLQPEQMHATVNRIVVSMN
jgi:site-specific recombinase XerD